MAAKSIHADRGAVCEGSRSLDDLAAEAARCGGAVDHGRINRQRCSPKPDHSTKQIADPRVPAGCDGFEHCKSGLRLYSDHAAARISGNRRCAKHRRQARVTDRPAGGMCERNLDRDQRDKPSRYRMIRIMATLGEAGNSIIRDKRMEILVWRKKQDPKQRPAQLAEP